MVARVFTGFRRDRWQCRRYWGHRRSGGGRWERRSRRRIGVTSKGDLRFGWHVDELMCWDVRVGWAVKGRKIVKHRSV